MVELSTSQNKMVTS